MTLNAIVGQQRRIAILDFVEEFQRDHGYPPTMREIGLAVGLRSTSSVKHQLDRGGLCL
jgi:repressor LexA